MALIDMLTDIKSFNYKSVGNKQGEYFGDKNATGFTTDRNTKDESEFLNKDSIFSKKGVDFFTNKNATGYTLDRREKDLPTGEYIANSGGIYNFKEKKGYSTFNNTKKFTIDRLVGDSSEFDGISGEKFQNGSTISLIKGVDFFTNRNRPGFLFDMTTTFDSSKTSLYIPGSGNPDYNFTEKKGYATFNKSRAFKIDANPGNRFKGGEIPDTEYPNRFYHKQGVDFFSNTYQKGFEWDATVDQDASKESFYTGIDNDELTFDSTTVFYGNISTTDAFPDSHGEGFEANANELYPAGEYGPGGRSGFYIEKIFENKDTQPKHQKFVTEYTRAFNARNEVVEFNLEGEVPKFGHYVKTSMPNLPTLETNDFVDHKYGTPLFTGLELRSRTDEIDAQYKKFGGNAGLRSGNPDNPGNMSPSLGWDNQPYIIKEIGDRSDFIGWGSVDGLTDIVYAGERTVEDLERIAKYLTSPKGLIFIGKQFTLQFGVEALGVEGNQFKKAKVFNPLGMLGSIVPTIHLPRHTNPLTLGLDVARPPKYENHKPGSGYSNDKAVGKGGKGEPLFTKIKDAVLDTVGLYKTKTPVQSSNVFRKRSESPDSNNDTASKYNLGRGKVRSKYGGGLYDVFSTNALQVPYGGKFGDLRKSAEKLPKDFIKFRIRDAVNGKWLIFPAQLGTITDTVTPEYAKERYIGRPDEVHIYTGTSRTVGFDFKVAAFTKQEIPIIQEKMNYLMGLGYPTFKSHIKGEDTQRMVTPYIYLTIGDLFNNTPGYFDNITITMEENATWEIDEGFQIPQFFNVSVNFVHIGKTLPTTIGKHYEVPHLTDVGVGKKQFGTFGKSDPKIKKNSIPKRKVENAGAFGLFDGTPGWATEIK